MKQTIIFLLFCIISPAGYAQSNGIPQEVHISINGTWFPTAKEGEATFGGNNELLKLHFSSYWQEFIVAGSKFNVQEFVEIEFTVNKEGKIQDVLFLNNSSIVNLDLTFLEVLNNTSGKWKPKIINGARVDVKLKIWGHFYSGHIDKYRLQELKPLIIEAKDNEQYKKAIKLVDIALAYVPIDEEYNEMKAELLTLSGDSKRLNAFLESIAKYKFSFVTDSIN